MKKISLILCCVILLPVMLCLGCDNGSEVGNIPDNLKEVEEYSIKGKTIRKGMTYSEVVDIIGKEGVDVGSGAVIIKWKLFLGKELYIWFSAYSGDTLNEFEVECIRIS